MMPTLLQDRVSQAFMTARRFRLDLTCAVPSMAARSNAVILNHPALPRPGSQSFIKLMELREIGVTKVKHLYTPPSLQGMGLKATVARMMGAVEASSWSLFLPHRSQPGGPDINMWPNMRGPLGCV